MEILLPNNYLHGENVGVGSILSSGIYHKLMDSKNIKFAENYNIDNNLIAEYYKDMYNEIVKENAPNSIKKVTPEIFYNNLDGIKNIISTIPTSEEFIELLDILGGVTNINCDVALVLKLAPYIRDRLTLLKLMRCIEI